MCTSVSWGSMPSIETVRRVTFQSVVGRIGCSITSELVGALMGRLALTTVVEDCRAFFGPSIRPLFSEPATLIAEALPMICVASRVKSFQNRLILGVICGSVLLYTHLGFQEDPEFTENKLQPMVDTLQHILSLFGENFGGFLGLAFIQAAFDQEKMVFWDGTESSYSVCMARHQMMGELIQQIVDPKIFFLKIPCAVGAIFFKTAAYNSNLLVPFIGKIIATIRKQESARKVLEPLLLETINRRFLSSSPSSKKQGKFYSIFMNLFQDLGGRILENLSPIRIPNIEMGELITRLLLRSFKGYISFVKHSPRILKAQNQWMKVPMNRLNGDMLVSELEAKIWGNSDPTQAVKRRFLENYLTDEDLNEITGVIVKEIKNGENELFGVDLTTIQDREFLQSFLTVHLKYFVFFMCLHVEESIRSSLDPHEDLQLIFDLNHLILSGYLSFVLPKSLSDQVQTICRFIEEQAFGLQKKIGVWICRGEQTTRLQGSIQIMDDYQPKRRVAIPRTVQIGERPTQVLDEYA